MKNKFIFHTIFNFFILTISCLICYFSLYTIYNPDLVNYISLNNSCGIISTCSVEPIFWIFADLSHLLHSIIDIKTITVTYFLFQFITLYIIYISALLFFNSYIRICFFFIIYLFCYSLIVIMIQIRFGLALSFTTLAFAMMYNNCKKIKYLIPILLGALSHFSVLPQFIFLLRNIFTFKVTLKKYIITILFFISILYSIKYKYIFLLLPKFVSSRLYQYFIADLQPSSLFNQIVSIILMTWLSIALFKIKSNEEKERWLLLLGTISFLPYIIYPEMEILIRIFIPFQYLLMIFYVKTFLYKKNLLLTTLPLSIFFLYKSYSLCSYTFNLIP